MTNSRAWPLLPAPFAPRPARPHRSVRRRRRRRSRRAEYRGAAPGASQAAHPSRVRRAASALHGESDWFPIRRARRWFNTGGIVIGEAYRPDLQPKLAGKAPLLRYDGNTGSGHVLVFAGSGGYKTTGTVIPSALEWPSGLVCLDPSAEVVRLVYRGPPRPGPSRGGA